MSTQIQRLATQALQTFSRDRNTHAFSEQLRILTDMMHAIKPADVKFHPELVENQEPHSASREPNTAPVNYLHFVQNEVFSMGIFVLRNGAVIPLHDHPGMDGLIKVLHGEALVKAFSGTDFREVSEEVRRSEKPRDVQRIDQIVCAATMTVVTIDSPPCVLTPVTGNYHQVAAVGGPMAFLDILSPPYDHDRGLRECHYYNELPFSFPLRSKDDGADGTNERQKLYFLEKVKELNPFLCGELHKYEIPEIVLPIPNSPENG